MKQKVKVLFAAVMILTLLFSMGVTSAFAEEESVNAISALFTRQSSSTSAFSVTAESTGSPTSMTLKITLQSATTGSSSYSNVSGVSPAEKTLPNVSIIGISGTFPTPTGKDYRIKIEATDVIGGVQHTKIDYEYL